MNKTHKPINAEPIIRVGILACHELSFELKGAFLCQGRTVLAGNYTISTTEIKTERIYTPIDNRSTFVLKNVTIGIGFHWEQQENQEFEGSLVLQVEGDKVRAVNAIPLENYLKSVISSEMSAMNDSNLLNAHAIVSRSWLLAQMANKNKPKLHTCTQNEKEIVKWYDREDHTSFDVCADDHCQRYQGITKVISKNAEKAIEATRGMVLMHKDEICDARFSKCCGGISEDFDRVWQPTALLYLSSIIDYIPSEMGTPYSVDNELYYTKPHNAFCNTNNKEILCQVLIDYDQTTSNFFRWKMEYRQNELSALINKKSGIDFGGIVDLIPLERGKSGRIIRLMIVGTKCKMTVGKELEIRKWLSDSHLYSSAFVVEKKFMADKTLPESFVLHGAGWGHGVGMCQIGAAVMSKQGYTATEILNHYFRDSNVEKLY
jgi:stage II sporulation protein D